MIEVLKKKVKRQFREKGFKELVFGSANTFVLRVVGMFIGYLFTYIIARFFGAKGVGVFTLSQTVLLMFTILSRLGMDSAITKLFSENAIKKRWDNIYNIYKEVYKLLIPLGIFWTMVLFFSSGYIAHYVFHKDYMAPYFQVIALGILPMSIRFVSSECYRGFKEVRMYAYSNNVSYFLYACIILFGMAMLTRFKIVPSDFRSFFPNIAFVLSLTVLAVTSSYLVYKKIKRHTPVASQEYDRNRILKVGVPMMMSNSLMLISGWINTIMLGKFATEADVGVYSVILKVTTVCSFILVSINSVAAPRFSELYAVGDMHGLARAARQTSKVNFFASIPIFIVIIIFRDFIMGIFGDEFLIGANILLFNMVGQFMNIFCGSVGSFLNMTGRQHIFQRILIISAVLNVIACFIFIPMYGLMGSAICTMIFMSSWNIISVIYINRKFNIETFYWPFGKSLKKMIMPSSHSRGSEPTMQAKVNFESIDPSANMEVVVEDYAETDKLVGFDDEKVTNDSKVETVPDKPVRKIDVSIIGVQKAATSSLHRYMAQHPAFTTHEQLEFAFFVRDEEYEAGYEKGYWKYFKEYDANKKILIKNVGLIYWQEALERLAAHNPDMKIIIVLRNPVDRAYSAYHYALFRGYEDMPTFEEALEADHNRFDDKITRGTVDYYERGNYVHQIKRVWKIFPQENVKIILQEDMKNNMEQIINECYQLAGVDTSFAPDLSIKFNESARAKYPALSRFIIRSTAIKSVIRTLLPEKMLASTREKVKNFNRESYTPPPMDPATRKMLIDYYRPLNEDLGKLLGRDLSHWNK